MRPDEVDRLADYLRAQLSGRVRDLHVAARADVVVLRGRTGSYYSKQLAQELLRRLTAVPLINEIDVHETADPWGFAAWGIEGAPAHGRVRLASGQ
jgi:hypothetical protein